MITTLIFDWGGVLTVGRHTAAVIRILEKEFNKDLGKEYDIIDGFVKLLDLGEIDIKEFTKMMERVDIQIDEEKMDHVFKDAINLNEEVIELIKKLKKYYKIIMMSNNNQPTVQALKTNHSQMLDLFDRIYFSFKLRIIKPDRRFFDFVIKDADLDAGECLFIDDKEKNIKAAKEAGIEGILFKNVEQLKKELFSFSIRIA